MRRLRARGCRTAGLPDFSSFKIPKRGENIPNCH
jgi:hypothetical protein